MDILRGTTHNEEYHSGPPYNGCHGNILPVYMILKKYIRINKLLHLINKCNCTPNLMVAEPR